MFAPYLFWPAYACGQLQPERSILMPCLHDEPEAHLDIFQDLFGSVRGIWFLSEPERDLARRIFTRLSSSETVGSGVLVPDDHDPERFRRAYRIDGRFVLYAGRREGGKNWERLLAGFAGAVERNPDLPLSLVTVGSGPVHAPAAIADRVIDLGFLPEADRDDAFAAADAYVQPSVNESFSRTMMEAWLAGTLVIANGGGAVNRWHCERSGAGLLYDDDLELEECLRFVAEAPGAAAELAALGRETRPTWRRGHACSTASRRRSTRGRRRGRRDEGAGPRRLPAALRTGHRHDRRRGPGAAARSGTRWRSARRCRRPRTTIASSARRGGSRRS